MCTRSEPGRGCREGKPTLEQRLASQNWILKIHCKRSASNGRSRLHSSRGMRKNNINRENFCVLRISFLVLSLGFDSKPKSKHFRSCLRNRIRSSNCTAKPLLNCVNTIRLTWPYYLGKRMLVIKLVGFWRCPPWKRLFLADFPRHLNFPFGTAGTNAQRRTPLDTANEDTPCVLGPLSPDTRAIVMGRHNLPGSNENFCNRTSVLAGIQ